MELKQDEGQFAFDGKLTIDAEAGNHAYALAYLPAGNYRFVINTGIAELGSSGGSFTLDSETVKAEAAGTDITVLNAAEALEGELDLSLGNISFSEENGQLTILYSKTDDSGQVVTAKLIDQSYDKCYRITSSGNKVENYHLSVDTPASRGTKARIKKPYDYTGRGYRTDSDKRRIPCDSPIWKGKTRFRLINQRINSSSPAGISVAKVQSLRLTVSRDSRAP